MNIEIIFTAITIFFGLYMAWNIGANDVSNAMGTSVGSKALTLQKAVILAGILEFAGAFLMGANVSSTIQQGIVDPSFFNLQPMIFAVGMSGSLLATGIWINVASYLHLPISTTHAIIGAVLGFGLAIGGFNAIHWEQLGYITLSWLTAPIISAVIAYFVFELIQKKILFSFNPLNSARRLAPYLTAIVLLSFSFNIFYKGYPKLGLNFSLIEALLISSTIGLVAALLSLLYIRKFPKQVKTNQLISPQNAYDLEKAVKHLQKTKLSSAGPVYEKSSELLKELKKLSFEVKKEIKFSESSEQYLNVEKIFSFLQIISACLVAFAHGSNDVANAIGPVAAVLQVINKKVIPETFTISPIILFVGGIGMVIGLSTWGWRVIETIGKKITELTPTRGFTAEISSALTIIVASKLGMPISTTHALVGAILGVGLARGLRSINLRTLKDILLSWFVTIPLCAILSIIIFYILKFIFVPL